MPWNEQAVENWWIGYCYTINAIIGAGILAIPWAYYTSGWVLGVLCQICILFLSIASSYLYLSAWSRMDILAGYQRDGIKYKKVSFKQAFQRPKSGEENLLSREGVNKPIIGEKKYDLYEMLNITMGKRAAFTVIASLTLGMYPVLTAYLSAFSISLASEIPLLGYTCNLYNDNEYFSDCFILYWIYLSIFATLLIFLSFFHIREHRWLQIPLTLFRFSVIVTMIVTCLYSYHTGTGLESSKAPNPTPEVFKISNIGTVFFIIMLASLYENLIPTATGFVKNKAEDIKKLINSAIFTFNSIYIVLGLVISLTIENPSQMASLNWINYSAGNNQDHREWWTYVIAYMVTLMPALDILTCFPIVANNFADNVMSITYGHKERHLLSRGVVIKYRMMIILPPIFLAVCVYSLGRILEFSGIFSLVLSGVLIPLASLAAQRLITEKSEYDFFDNYIVAVALIIFSLILLVVNIVLTVASTIS